MAPKPHATVVGVPGVSYSRQTYHKGDTITGTDRLSYTVTDLRDDGDVFGDGCRCVEVFTEPAPENLRICQG